MKLRLRFKEKQQVIEIGDELVLVELLSLINDHSDSENTSQISVKFGFPPRELPISDNELSKISDLGIRNGEVLIINYPTVETGETGSPLVEKRQFNNPDNVPYVETETGYLLVHKVPDDNSCLFHSIIYSANLSEFMNVHDLRSIVSNTIKENRDQIYNEAILGKSIEEYCEWILNPQAWGGEIEITILSQFLNLEIITIDIESKHDYKFNESLDSFILLAYSGIHYDSIIYQPDQDLTNDKTKVGKFWKTQLLSFETKENYPNLINTMNIMGYYTNTSNFKLRCGECFKLLVGEKDASEHATETGHYKFGEYK